MKTRLFQIFTLLLSVVMLVTASGLHTAAASASEIRQSINKLESKSQELEKQIKSLQGKINEQEKLKKALEEKISVVQQQINICNNEISKINSAIAANKAEIEKCNKEMEADKLSFKKRIRAIYMSNTGSSVQVIMGADDFSDYLQLSQLVASISGRDKLLMEKIIETVKKLQAKQEENNKLLEEQVEIKKIVTQKQNELKSQSNAIQSVINDIAGDKKDLASENAKIEKQIKEYNATLASMTSTAGTSFTYDGAAFLWPVSGYYMISAGFQSNDSVHRGHHNGIDIAGSGIAGKPILAIADGVVTKSNNNCPHNYPKRGSCGCGGGYGNYVTINHGTNNGKTYVVTYGHMSSAAVSTGARVKKGQVIGYVGTTGWSTGYHLHFGIAVNGIWVNPLSYYKKVG